MRDINQEEYEVLKPYISEEKYIAKDRDGSIRLLTDYPERDMKRGEWSDGWGKSTLKNSANNFQFIKWEDDEPYNIAELIEDYESEETEVKNIEWLRKDFDRIFDQSIRINSDKEWDKGWNVGWYEARTTVYALIDQLDEPEVLSQEWIDEHVFGDWHEYVYADDLKGIIVPKQEITEEQAKDALEEKGYTIARMYDSDNETVLPYDFYRQVLLAHGYVIIEKPVIPKFVAEWIEDLKSKKINLLENIYDFTHDEDINNYIREHGNTLMRAWLDGYEVAEEQKYYVMNNDNRMMLVRMMDGKTITEADPFKLEDMYEVEKKSHRLTEQEIKDYDERYWPFAKEVTE